MGVDILKDNGVEIANVTEILGRLGSVPLSDLKCIHLYLNLDRCAMNLNRTAAVSLCGSICINLHSERKACRRKTFRDCYRSSAQTIESLDVLKYF